MTSIAAPLGILACLSMAGAACGAAIPSRHDSICYGGRDAPKKVPEQPFGCHAMTGCAEHRRLRTFP
jgi:hypothetical protein